MDRDDDGSRDREVKDLLRRALEPDARSVARIVAQALRGAAEGGAARSRHRSWWSTRVLTAAAAVLLVGVAIGTTIWLRGPSSSHTARGTISNQGDIIVLIAPNRPITLIGPGPAPSIAPPGTASIVLLGEPQ